MFKTKHQQSILICPKNESLRMKVLAKFTSQTDLRYVLQLVVVDLVSGESIASSLRNLRHVGICHQGPQPPTGLGYQLVIVRAGYTERRHFTQEFTETGKSEKILL